jgi:hypothetical protein
MRKIKIITLFITISTLLLLAGCGPAKPSALSNEQVVSLTSEVLTALDTADYDLFTSQFSPDMLTAFPEADFEDLRNLLQTNSGGFVACSDEEPGLSNNKGYAIYRLICTYDLEDVAVTIVFKVDGSQVEGLFFDSPNLRAVSK